MSAKFVKNFSYLNIFFYLVSSKKLSFILNTRFSLLNNNNVNIMWNTLMK